MSVGVEAKQLQILKDVVPGLSRVAVLTNPTNTVNSPIVASIERAGSLTGLTIQVLQFESGSDLAQAFDAALAEKSGAVLVLRDDLFNLERHQVAALAKDRKLPTMAGWSEYGRALSLLAYGVNFSDLFRRAARYVDKVLKGIPPGELPIAQPEKFELTVNLRTARDLGLSIPGPGGC